MKEGLGRLALLLPAQQEGVPASLSHAAFTAGPIRLGRQGESVDHRFRILL